MKLNPLKIGNLTAPIPVIQGGMGVGISLHKLAGAVAAKKAVSADIACGYESGLIRKLSVLTDQIAAKTDELEAAVLELKGAGDVMEESAAIRDTVIGKMAALRTVADEAETITAEKYWPFPTYGELLFGVR